MANKTRQTRKTKQKKSKVDTVQIVLYFIEQKIFEIIAIGLGLFSFYSLGKWNPLNLSWDTTKPILNPTGFWDFVNIGLIYFILAMLAAMAAFMIYVILRKVCQANWEWAKERARK